MFIYSDIGARVERSYIFHITRFLRAPDRRAPDTVGRDSVVWQDTQTDVFTRFSTILGLSRTIAVGPAALPTAKVPLNWRTRNYVGVIFGGSMYGAIDPLYMMMLINRLGDEADTVHATVRKTVYVSTDQSNAA